MIRIEDLRALSQPSASRALFAIFADWVLIAANFALAIYWPTPLVWLFCWLFAARQQLALAILMHDGAHRRLFKSAVLNDYFCQFFCGAPLFFSMYSYQRLHLKHHRAPLVADDPDLSLIGGYPISRASFARKLARDAFGISYIKFIRYFIHMSRRPKAQPSVAGSAEYVDLGPAELKTQAGGGRIGTPMLVLSVLVMNFLLWSILYLLDQPWLYLFFWVLPALTALQLLLRIRGIAEHAGYKPNHDQRLNARTVLNPMQTFIFAPHNVAYHIEHHVYPAVPYFNLPRLHRLMMEQNMLPAANMYPGYGKVLRELIKTSAS